MKILGEQFGIELYPRDINDNDNHVCIKILSEDDEYWHETDATCSSAWIDDLINQLKAAKSYMEANCDKDKDGCGYQFKRKQ